MAKRAPGKKKKARALVPRRASSELSRQEGDVDRMFEDFLGRRPWPFWPERWWPAASMRITTPAVDLYEEKDDIVVKAELPGMEKDNIEVNLSDNRLTIKGEKKQEEEVQKEGYYRSERSYGSFVRTLELPRKVQTDKVKAAFKNGILEIRVPKTEEAKKREMTVKVN
ncbi:MAG TPA: Hsp20/alpha crystallin family protein [Candidatus Binatia bacterium]|nr:Hsp20/alpha crystallin family protein [Candidatus Binatia bacterium]